MRKRFVLFLCIVFILSFVFSGCRTGDPKATDPDDERLARIYAVEDKYEIVESDKTLLTAGVYMPYPTVRGMINLTKQGVVNGRITAFLNRTAVLPDGKTIPRYTGFTVPMLNQHILCMEFIADTRVPHSDEAMVFFIEADALAFNVRRIADDASTNNKFDDLFRVFDTKRNEQNQKPLTMDELPEAFIGFEGEDVSDMNIIIYYYKDGKNRVEIDFYEIADYLSSRGKEMTDFKE
ncbi:MAG: hypothetical protein R6W96_06380 [Clostridia bacterium]